MIKDGKFQKKNGKRMKTFEKQMLLIFHFVFQMKNIMTHFISYKQTYFSKLHYQNFCEIIDLFFICKHKISHKFLKEFDYENENSKIKIFNPLIVYF